MIAPFSLLVPVFGLTSAFLFLGETISREEALGSALLVIALGINTLAIRAKA